MSAVAPIVPFRDIYIERAQRLMRFRSMTAKQQHEIRAYYKRHIADFVNDWGVTYDPRNVRKGLPVVMPFTLDPRQREWIDFTFQNWQDGKYGGTEKSRDVGCSWLIVGFSIALAVLYENIGIGWGSFKQEKVDQRGDMGSLFEKGRAFLEGLPIEFRGGYKSATCSLERRLLFPETGAAIIGEIGDNIGRGNRTSVYFVDEAAYLEHDQIVDAALSKTTDCRQDISSVHGMTNSFAERMHDGKSRKFTFHWRENPRMTQEDYDEFLEQWGPVITAQELDINYSASVEGIIIPSEWVQAAIDAHLAIDIKAHGVKDGALDVADEGIDKNAFAGRTGQILSFLEMWSGKNSDIFATAERAFRICDELRLESFSFDNDGLGAGIAGDARVINDRRATDGMRRIRVNSYRGSAEVLFPDDEMVKGRKNCDMFANYKAQSWWHLRMMFQETWRARNGKAFKPELLISISSEIKELSRLIVELSQPVYKFNTAGKMLVDKKPNGVASPNLADAIVILFAPKRRKMVIADELLNSFQDG